MIGFAVSWWITFPLEWCTTMKASVSHSLRSNLWSFTQPYGMETHGQQDGEKLNSIGPTLLSSPISETSMPTLASRNPAADLARASMAETTEVLILKVGRNSKKCTQNGWFMTTAVISDVMLMMVCRMNAAKRISSSLCKHLG